MIENCQVGTTIFTGMRSLHERYIQQAEAPKPNKQVCVQRHSSLGGQILYHLGPGIYIYIWAIYIYMGNIYIYGQYIYICLYIYIYLLEDETCDVYNICLCIFNLVHIYCCISIEYV